MRILIVEDDKKIADAIKKGFSQESYACDVEYDGDSGLGAAKTFDYDLIILDWMLPGISGFEVCRKIRQQQIQAPVLFLTAKDTVDDKIEGLDCGADDYLSKPFDFGELLARARALLRRPKTTKDAILAVGKIKVDSRGKKVSISGEVVELSNKEYAILNYLMMYQGQVFSKDQLIEHVWDFDADVLPNNVEVFISNIRKKISKIDQSAAKQIKTIRGFGYKIDEPADK